MTWILKKIKTVIVVFLILAAFVQGTKYVLYNVLFPQKYSQYVEKYSKYYCLNNNFVYAVIKAESNFNSNACSGKNAKGLMQITDITGEWAAEMLGKSDFNADMLYEPETNIEIGCWYLDRLIKQYRDVDTAIAAYNAGSGNVSDWISQNPDGSDELDKENIPFKETKNYVEKVNQYLKIYNFLYK